MISVNYLDPVSAPLISIDPAFVSSMAKTIPISEEFNEIKLVKDLFKLSSNKSMSNNIENKKYRPIFFIFNIVAH